MSVDVSVIRVTSAHRETLIFAIQSQYDSEGCGICEKAGAEAFWFSPYSRAAHAKCFTLIEKAEERLINSINELFKSTAPREKNKARTRAVQAVRLACGSETILSFCEKNGVEALTHLFDTVGINAARKLPAKLQS